MASKVATFASTVKLGGDITYSGTLLEIAPDGAELVYGSADALFRLRRGDKALKKVDTARVASAMALGGGLILAGAPYQDDGDSVDVYDQANAVVARYVLPAEASLQGCTGSTQAGAIVAWARAESGALEVYWWSLGAPDSKPVVHALTPSGVVDGATFVGETLFLTTSDKLFAATASKLVQVATGELMPGRIDGATAGDRLVVRSGKCFVTLKTDGTVLHAFPPLFKLARITPDGKHVLFYGTRYDVRTPADAAALFPEGASSDFVAWFDAATGERLGWGKMADSLDALAMIEGELIVGKSVKRLAVHPWKLIG